mmetsp:Transcript_114380/g.328601  ORF Transcript_114380/g.328601 Transcript_114380/m.328601 type:complete len:374 (+) Transcript_114380:630-1751(+)
MQPLADVQGHLQAGVVDALRVHALVLVGSCVEGVVERLPHSRPGMAVMLQHLPQEVLGLPRKVELVGRRSQPVRQRLPAARLALEDGRRDVRQKLLAREHHEEYDAAAPDVALWPIDAVPKFRRHVGRRPLDLVAPLPVEAAAQPEVDHHQVCAVGVGEHEVLWLDVVVPPVLRMATLQGLQHVAQRDRGIVLGHTASLSLMYSTKEVGAAAQLEYEVYVRFLVIEFDKLDDVWVVEGQQRGELMLVQLTPSLGLLQTLHSPRQIQGPVRCPEDLAKPTLADLLLELVCGMKRLAGVVELEEIASMSALGDQEVTGMIVRRLVWVRQQGRLLSDRITVCDGGHPSGPCDSGGGKKRHLCAWPRAQRAKRSRAR